MLNKIKQNAFLKSTLILLFGGVFGKIVGFFLRIIVTRNLGTEGMGIYSLLNPTSSLLSVLAVFSYSNAISKIVSEETNRSKNVMFSIIPISIIINMFFIAIIVLISKYLSYSLINNYSLYLPIIFLSLTMPFISVSAIIKGYFWGKQNMFPYMLSNFIEQIVRFVFISFLIKKTLYNGIIFTICFISVVNIIGAISSQIIMAIFFSKAKISKCDF